MNIGVNSPAGRKISDANEIVSFAKAVSREVASFELPNEINFIGCSMPYVKEKLNAAIHDLQWLRKHLTHVNELQHHRRKQPGGEL